MKAKKKIDRGAVMRAAGRLMREQGMNRSDAMRAAWAMAKSAAPAKRQLRQQEAGARAALRRYGVDADRIKAAAVQAVVAAVQTARKAVAAIAADRPAMLPPPAARSIDLTRGSDGVYRIK